MSTAALLESKTPQPVKLCANCRWSRDIEGNLFAGQDRAYCGSPEITTLTDTGKPVPCEIHRFSRASTLLQVCGEEAIFWEPRA